MTILIVLQNYFLLAARLGDVDAQQDVGFCYSHGKGVGKDRKEAAKWYRAAVSPFNVSTFIILTHVIGRTGSKYRRIGVDLQGQISVNLASFPSFPHLDDLSLDFQWVLCVSYII